jgi:hypothetical protein
MQLVGAQGENCGFGSGGAFVAGADAQIDRRGEHLVKAAGRQDVVDAPGRVIERGGAKDLREQAHAEIGGVGPENPRERRGVLLGQTQLLQLVIERRVVAVVLRRIAQDVRDNRNDRLNIRRLCKSCASPRVHAVSHVPPARL